MSLAVTDYYNYDKITNIERVTPENVTFTAITVCALSYTKEPFNTLDDIPSSITSNDLNVPLIKSFIVESIFYKTNEQDVRNLMEFFTILRSELDCFRFNALTYQSNDLFNASLSGDYFHIYLNNCYIDINVTLNEYYN